MNNQLYCPDETRKAMARAGGAINGIDFLEVLDDEAPAGSVPQRTLLAHCFLAVTGLSRNNVRIEGGVRVKPVNALWAYPANAVPNAELSAAERPAMQAYLAALPNPNRTLVVRTDSQGDFSTYTLRLVSPTAPSEPPAGFDRLLSAVDFSFKVDCPSEFDCRRESVCVEPPLPAPQIDYLAKDYASFRRLMLDRMAVTMPDWQERNPADVGVALVELLAYAGDRLSYFQDAVATEAYLGTARRRVSVRRHARLADYFVHDGANARAWVCFEVEAGGGADGATLNAGARLLSLEGSTGTIAPPEKLNEALAGGPIVFETLHDVELKSRRNKIDFYTWSDPRCCLPKGATRATLRGGAGDLELRAGDALIFEEALGPESGLEVDADPARRHVVRLKDEPRELTDPLTGEVVLEIGWHGEDALPFPLCLWRFDGGAGAIRQASVARGNVALADHGLTISDEDLQPASAPEGRRYRPRLRRSGLTHAMAYDDGQARQRSAASATALDLRRVSPQVVLQGDGEIWKPQRDLLNSDRFAAEFVVEMEDDGSAFLRFGDDVLGRAPSGGAAFKAAYRIGNGRAGAVGAEALTRVAPGLTGIESARNPMAAVGGVDPEPIEQARLYAPQAFRTQERAVTEADYAAAAQRHPEVQRAAATRRWTGSWHTIFVTVDRRGGRAVDAEFEAELRAFLERFRMAGYDLEVDAPRFAPLDILLTVCVAPRYVRGNVKLALLDTFSNRDLPDGRRGFFHPDNFTFGQPVYLSQVIAAVMQTPGVEWVTPARFQRYGQNPRDELKDGLIAFGRLEIARLDNDPNAAENGRIDFDMKGGL